MAIGDGLRALIVEDDESVRALVSRVLTVHGFDVEAARDGLSGLVKLDNACPDIVICDIMMPRLDGLTFARAIKNHERSRDVPVIFLTAKTDVPTVVEGMKAGAFWYLAKPFKRDDLVERVKEALVTSGRVHPS